MSLSQHRLVGVADMLSSPRGRFFPVVGWVDGGRCRIRVGSGARALRVRYTYRQEARTYVSYVILTVAY